MLPLAVILAVVLSGCDRSWSDPDNNPVHQPAEQGVWIGEEGGVVTIMDGDVVITIPAGALTERVRFDVHELINKSGGNFAMKTIVIEPLIVFKEPAQLSMRYDGCLGHGLDLCQAKSVLFAIWDDEGAFLHENTPKVCSNCNVNKDSRTLGMLICQTGVIATIAEW